MATVDSHKDTLPLDNSKAGLPLIRTVEIKIHVKISEQMSQLNWRSTKAPLLRNVYPT